MRISFTLAALLFFWSPAQSFTQGQQLPESPQSQKPSTHVADCRLPESFDLLKIESSGALLHGDGHFRNFPGGPYDLKSMLRASVDFKSWLEKNKGRDEMSDGYCYFSIISKYAPALITLLDSLRLEEVVLLYDDNDMPFRLFAKEKSEGVLLSAVTSGQIYNILKLDARQRAAKEFDSTGMPILRKMRTALSQMPVQFYGVIISYGARDFSQSEEGGMDVYSDVLAVVTERENCQNLEEGKITEDEFADKSDIYLSSGSDPALVKTRLKFE